MKLLSRPRNFRNYLEILEIQDTIRPENKANLVEMQISNDMMNTVTSKGGQKKKIVLILLML